MNALESEISISIYLVLWVTEVEVIRTALQDLRSYQIRND